MIVEQCASCVLLFLTPGLVISAASAESGVLVLLNCGSSQVLPLGSDWFLIPSEVVFLTLVCWESFIALAKYRATQHYVAAAVQHLLRLTAEHQTLCYVLLACCYSTFAGLL